MRKKKAASNIFFIIFFVVFLIAFAGVYLWQRQWKEAIIEVGGEQLYVQVARTPSQWHKGLGGRDTLAPYEGLLFTFGESKKHTIVMRDMRFPIDIVWIKDGQIVSIQQNAPVPKHGTAESELVKYVPTQEATAVLELPAGFVAKNGFDLATPVRVRGE